MSLISTAGKWALKKWWWPLMGYSMYDTAKDKKKTTSEKVFSITGDVALLFPAVWIGSTVLGNIYDLYHGKVPDLTTAKGWGQVVFNDAFDKVIENGWLGDTDEEQRKNLIKSMIPNYGIYYNITNEKSPWRRFYKDEKNYISNGRNKKSNNIQKTKSVNELNNRQYLRTPKKGTRKTAIKTKITQYNPKVSNQKIYLDDFNYNSIYNPYEKNI